MRLDVEYLIEDARDSPHIPLNRPYVAHSSRVAGGNHYDAGGQVVAVSAAAAAAAAAVVTLVFSSVLRLNVSVLLSSNVAVMGVEWAALVRVQVK
jgi:hypothetical protein